MAVRVEDVRAHTDALHAACLAMLFSADRLPSERRAVRWQAMDVVEAWEEFLRREEGEQSEG